MNEIEDKLRKNLAPLKIKVDITYEDNIYYIVMDGRQTYQDNKQWIERWPGGIDGFGRAFLSLEKIHPTEVITIEPAVVRFTIGSLFDLLK